MAGDRGAGPVVVEVNGSAEGLRVIDYACTEAIRDEAELVLVAAHRAPQPGSGGGPQPSAERAGEFLRVATAHIRRQIGTALEVAAVCGAGTRLKVLSTSARGARALIIGRPRHRGPERLVAARSNLLLARRIECPLIVVPGSWKLAPSQRDVAVGVDGTELSAEAVGYAFRAAAARGGNLIAVHAAPRFSAPDGGWILKAERELAEVLGRWSAEYAEVKVTRYLTRRPVVAALVHKSREVSLVVLGAHAGILPIGDPVTRRAMAAVAGPVAIVPHRPVASARLVPGALVGLIRDTYPGDMGGIEGSDDVGMPCDDLQLGVTGVVIAPDLLQCADRVDAEVGAVRQVHEQDTDAEWPDREHFISERHGCQSVDPAGGHDCGDAVAGSYCDPVQRVWAV